MTSLVTDDMARDLAAGEGVCVRPLLRRLTDRLTGLTEVVTLPCGSTRSSHCPPCAEKARHLRMHQCAEGWHLTEEPPDVDRPDPEDEIADEPDDEAEQSARRTRSTRHRGDVADLPTVPVEDRTIGRTFETSDGKTWRPSMFVTLTLPSYGRVTEGVPVDPKRYDYRRAALDALHFAKLYDRWVQNLRRAAGYKIQYFAAVEPQKRLSPHLHAALRGAISRRLIRQVTAGTYFALWWPAFDTPVYVDHLPAWDGDNYVDPATGEILPTWEQAVDNINEDGPPAHVMRFGAQLDIQGLIADSPDSDRAIRYLTKYLSKSIADAYSGDDTSANAEAHVDRLHREVRWLPCSPRCTNWLRYGVQPEDAGPGMQPGRCPSPAHDRENLGLGGRRVLVSRKWTGKTLDQHRADRAEVVRQVLAAAGIEPPDPQRCAANQLHTDGQPRWLWEPVDISTADYRRVIAHCLTERRRWKAQYAAAKASCADPPKLVHSHSAIAAKSAS